MTTNSNNYPFATKKQIKIRLEEGDIAHVLEALLILDGRQTDDEREVKDTIYKNRRGWMCSHATAGTNLASKVALKEALTEEEEGKARSMVCRYSRQLASYYRDKALRDAHKNGDTALLAQAAKFGLTAI
jgi:hypothetical protein